MNDAPGVASEKTGERFLFCPTSPRMERGAITRLGVSLETHPAFFRNVL